MKQFSFYEQVGIVIPGILFLFGATFYIPEFKALLAKDGVSVGGLGLYVLVAYAIGHAIAALGNLIESMYWSCRGGMPTNWVVGPKPRLLAPAQIQKLEAQVTARLGLTIGSLATMERSAWFPISRQLYSVVERSGKVDRVEIFNGNYGLNRGLCAAAVGLAALAAIMAPQQWPVAAGITALALIFLYRMQRFGQHYARELFNQFLTLPPPAPLAPPATPQPAAVT